MRKFALADPELLWVCGEVTCGWCVWAEWHFRSSLDRYVWIHGMLCAFLKPWAEGFLQRIDSLAIRARFAARAAVIACEPPIKFPANGRSNTCLRRSLCAQCVLMGC